MSNPIPKLLMGKYKGRRFDQVPVDYLRYLLTLSKLYPETRTLIDGYLKQKAPVKKEKLDYKPELFKKPVTPIRTEEGKRRFRELSRQVKERVFGHA